MRLILALLLLYLGISCALLLQRPNGGERTAWTQTADSSSRATLRGMDPRWMYSASPSRTFSPAKPLLSQSPAALSRVAVRRPIARAALAGKTANQKPMRRADTLAGATAATAATAATSATAAWLATDRSGQAPGRALSRASSSGGRRPVGRAALPRVAASVVTQQGLAMPRSGQGQPPQNTKKPLSKYQLATELQTELRRAGCYHGQIDGIWGPGSKRAMAAFTARINAALAVAKPTPLLLTLIRGRRAVACGGTCPAGQSRSASGRCMVDAVVRLAKREKNKWQTTVKKRTNDNRSLIASARAPLTAFAPPSSFRLSSRHFGSGFEGRMSMGGPRVAGVVIRAPSQTRAKRSVRTAARNARAQTPRLTRSKSRVRRAKKRRHVRRRYARSRIQYRRSSRRVVRRYARRSTVWTGWFFSR